MSVFALAAGCVGNDSAIEYRVEGGLAGRGDGSPALRIEPDGTVIRTPREGDPDVRVLSYSTRSALRDRIDALQSRRLADSYPMCCDFYDEIVTVDVGPHRRTISVSERDLAPRELVALIDLLHDIANDE